MSIRNLEGKRGDTWYWEFEILQADGETPQNITSATFRFTAKYRIGDGDGSAPIVGTSGGGQCVITGASTGKMTVQISKTATAAVDAPCSLEYDLQATDAGGLVWTPFEGRIDVSADVSVSQP